ncbi:MAG: Na+/H+ antiporter NhaC family protein, partial [Faecousia sp.]
FFYDRKTPFGEKLAVYSEGAGRPGVMQLGLVVLLAGGFASAGAAIGGKESIVNLGISFIPSSMLIPGIFVISAIISTCIGTSMGTLSAMLPVAFALSDGAGLVPGMAAASCIAGAYFGDNLSMISDTTICATEGVGAQMKDKFRMNFLIALPAAILTVVMYIILSMGSTPESVTPGSYNLMTVVPYIAVLVLALIGVDVVLVLSGGIVLSCVIGLACGTTDFFTFAQKVSSGMEGMFWLAVFSMMTSGLVALVRYYGGVEWMVEKATGLIRGRKSCEYVIGAFSLVLSGTIVNNTMGIMIFAPIAKILGDKFGIAPKRMASLLDIGACLAIMIVPHGMAVMMVQEQFNCSYLDMMKYNFYPLFLAIAVIITIQFGLMRTKEEKGEKEQKVK